MVDLGTLAYLAFSGLVTGSLYAVVAVGFGVIVRSTRVINFAQGDFLTMPAYIAWFLADHSGVPFAGQVLIAFAAVVVLGWLVQRLMIQPLMGQPLLATIMVTIGLSFIMQGVLGFFFGSAHSLLETPLPTLTWKAGPLRIQPIEVAVLATAVVLLGGFLLFFQQTKLGLAMRATASREDVAELMGIRIERVYSMAWMLAGLVSAVAGVLLGAMQGVTPQMGSFAFKVFPALIIGGLDNVAGSMIGGLAVGLIENLIGGALDLYTGGGAKELIAYVLLVLLLVVRPYGFFGRAEIRRI